MTFMILANGRGDIGALDLGEFPEDVDVWDRLYGLDPRMYDMVGLDDVVDIFEDMVGSILLEDYDDLREFFSEEEGE